MRLLLDTHIALWAIVDDPRLPAKARTLIEDQSNSVAVSVASIWEIAIKHSLSKGRADDMPIDGAAAVGYFRSAGYVILDIVAEHVVAVAELAKHHKDPFDRLLVAQASVETLQLVTSDTQVAAYGGSILLV